MGIYDDLKEAALRKRVVDFEDRAAIYDDGQQEGLILLLRNIALHEHRKGFPLLPAIVVERGSGRPPSSVMEVRNELHLRPAEDDRTFWTIERELVFKAAYMEKAASVLSPYVGAGLIAPLPTHDPADVLNNGTVSFIDTGDRRFLVTCAHVYDEFLEKRIDDPRISFVLAGANGIRPIDISNAVLIDREREHLDLVTLDLPRADLLLELNKQFFHSSHWPPPRPIVSDAVAGVGYPGKNRGTSSRGLELRMTPIVLTVSSVSDRHFVLADDDSPRTYMRLNSEITDEVVFGGLSGCSVYVWEPDRQDFRLGGFFYEAADRLDTMMYVVHADYIRGDGTFDRGRMPW